MLPTCTMTATFQTKLLCNPSLCPMRMHFLYLHCSEVLMHLVNAEWEKQITNAATCRSVMSIRMWIYSQHISLLWAWSSKWTWVQGILLIISSWMDNFKNKHNIYLMHVWTTDKHLPTNITQEEYNIAIKFREHFMNNLKRSGFNGKQAKRNVLNSV